MDVTVTNLVKDLLDTMNELGVPLGGNTKKLALLDAESADKHIEELEDKIEDLEFAAEDYFTIDKSELEVFVTNTMRKMFYPSGETDDYTPTSEDDYDSFIDDMVAILKTEFEKGDKNA